ncbi:MAG: four helix bundle protein [Chloroflexi bacterium]|nr:four helix bundle protein [Chloroflexota bacterium]
MSNGEASGQILALRLRPRQNFASSLAIQTVAVPRAEPITEEIAVQLYAAVCSIEANISEGYSRSSGKVRARIFEYAMASVRESMSAYKSSSPILGDSTVKDRRDRLEEMSRLLLTIVPRERGRPMR